MKIRNISARVLILRDSSNNEYRVPAYGDLSIIDALWSDNEFRRWIRMRIRDVAITEEPVEPPMNIATSVDGLGTPVVDGALGLIRLGTWPDQYEVQLRWNDAESKWISEPQTVVTATDQWGQMLSGTPNYITWQEWKMSIPYGKSGRTFITGSPITLPTGTITVNSTTGFSTAGILTFPNNMPVNYTGGGGGGTTFTGCTGGTGTYSATTWVQQGEVGGWGMTSSPLLNAGAFWAAGLRLQENLTSTMNGNGTQAIDLAAYWYQYNLADNTAFATPPSGGLGFSTILTGPTSNFIAQPAERPFQWKSTGWTTWAAGTPTKSFLMPKMYGRMNGGTGTVILPGEIVDTTLRMRWTS